MNIRIVSFRLGEGQVMKGKQQERQKKLPTKLYN